MRTIILTTWRDSVTLGCADLNLRETFDGPHAWPYVLSVLGNLDPRAYRVIVKSVEV